MIEINVDDIIDTMQEITDFFKIIRIGADKAKDYSSDRKVADLETLSLSLKKIEDCININKKNICLLPLNSIKCDNSNNTILNKIKEVR